MQEQIISNNAATENLLRPVVVIVVAAKLAVFALLMTTLNIPAPIAAPIEVADLR